MLKRPVVFAILILIFPVISFSQLSSSPYSLFAVGNIDNYGFGTNNSMGGVGIGLKSENWLNNLNPASYYGIDTLRFILEFGLTGKRTNYQTKSLSDSKNEWNFSYLAMGFRLAKKLTTSIGLIPVSTVGYEIDSYESIEGLTGQINKTYKGDGGINQFYIGNSYKINKNLSFGLNISYYFGKINQLEIFKESNYFNGYEVNNSYYLGNFHFDYGLQYTIKPKEIEYTLGVVFGNQKTLNSKNDLILIMNYDTIEMVNDIESNFYIPLKFGAGIGISKENKFRAGLDYEINKWSVAEYTKKNVEIRNSERIAVGFDYLPYRGMRDKGLRTIHYRAGVNYKKSYLVVNDEPINSASVSLGFGIPIKRELSMINLSFEYGKNGTTKNNLILENYFMIHLNITLRDIWFQKSKFL